MEEDSSSSSSSSSSSFSPTNILDLAIIGAGWHGITMAKTYHTAYPTATIAILDSATSLGGTWALERLYPHLKTNNSWGSYEFSDLPMSRSKYGGEEENHIPGRIMHRYLCDAVKEFGLEGFLRLGRRVVGCELKDGVWEVRIDGDEKVLLAKKLVLATGLTSEPFMPKFPGMEKFEGSLIHSKQLLARAEDLAKAKKVVVVGGNKSAWDVAYSVAKQGGKAHMIMRPTGAGPNYAWPRLFRFLGKMTSLPLLSMTRFWVLFDPWPFDQEGKVGNGWLRTFLHRFWVGRWITAMFWGYLRERNTDAGRFEKDDRVKMLKPWSSPYWMGGSLGTLNYDTDWFEEVRKGNIIPHHDEVQSLDSRSVILSSGSVISDVDATVCCTGWRPISPIKISPPELIPKLGLPHQEEIESLKEIQTHTQTILSARPAFANPPRASSVPSSSSPPQPFRLYRFLAPPSHQPRNFACIGINYSLQTTIVSQIQALWITAYLNDHIPNISDKISPTLLHTTYETLRRPKSGSGFGEKHPDLVFDSLYYIDMLLHDLGLETRRKKGWWREWFEPYGLGDYRGLVEEWKGKVGEKGK